LSYPVLARATRLAGAVVLAVALILAASGMAASNASAQGSGGAGIGSASSPAPTSAPKHKPKAPRKKVVRRRGPSKAANSALPGDSKHLGDRVLRQGMSGHDVRVLQDYLSRVGFGTSIDGSFGPSTKANVIAFQRSVNMPADGVVTVAVEKALRAAVAKIQADPPTGTTRINSDGTATAPAGAPTVVREAVAAANRIIHTSYCYAGGHASFNSSCYDCSGTVSYVLHGAGLLSQPMDSTDLESYGKSGPGKWITIYADPSHTWIVIAGRAFDTADFGGPNIPAGTGPRWRTDPTGNLGDGGDYIVRHPDGW
jgi:peptidoglycan hydrolase-like protein with peptidoglycan-binding domain